MSEQHRDLVGAVPIRRTVARFGSDSASVYLSAMATYHPKIQPLVTYLESLRGSSAIPDGLTLDLAPSGQTTNLGNLGVTLMVSGPRSSFLEVEDTGAADHYCIVRHLGNVVPSMWIPSRYRSKDDPRIHYGGDIVAFIAPHIEKFLSTL
jgi:hypothetical protein